MGRFNKSGGVGGGLGGYRHSRAAQRLCCFDVQIVQVLLLLVLLDKDWHMNFGSELKSLKLSEVFFCEQDAVKVSTNDVAFNNLLQLCNVSNLHLISGRFPM